uniref:Mitochondria-eating protein n=1 Tax=Ciona savignyi TaxID=51511 RepID=H2YV38_CIOSA
MSETIRRLADSSSYMVLQDKIAALKDGYTLNTCDTNLGHICELIELTSKIQNQLFTAMSLTASEGGTYGGVDTLKSRLLPWLGTSFMTSGGAVTSDTSLTLLKVGNILLFGHYNRLQFLKSKHDNDVTQLEAELNETKEELDLTRDDLRLAKEAAARYKRQLDLVGDFEHEVEHLKGEIRLLRSERDILESRVCDYERPLPPPSSPPTHAELTNSIRHSRLVARFNDLYAVDRLDMQDRLRRFVDDDEMVKRIIFIAVCEAFHVAKMAYRSFRLRARKLLSPIHSGPTTLEEAVTDYIVRNLDLYDVERSVEDVIRAMNVNPKISFPPECEFVLLSPFIREVCLVAYRMQALEPPLDIPLATDGELMNESRYRRSYDSEFTAPLVAYHIWPALVEDGTVLIKGECTTRRGAVS